MLPLSEGGDWGWGAPSTIGLLVAAVVLLALLTFVERRSAVRCPLDGAGQEPSQERRSLLGTCQRHASGRERRGGGLSGDPAQAGSSPTGGDRRAVGVSDGVVEGELRRYGGTGERPSGDLARRCALVTRETLLCSPLTRNENFEGSTQRSPRNSNCFRKICSRSLTILRTAQLRCAVADPRHQSKSNRRT